MPGEVLCPNPSEISAFVLIDNNLVVRRLAGKELAAGVNSSGGNRMHFRFGDVLGDNRNPELPNEKLLVVGAADELVLLDEGDAIHRPQMLAIVHLLLPRIDVELHDFLVARSHQEHILFVICRVEFHAEWQSL